MTVSHPPDAPLLVSVARCAEMLGVHPDTATALLNSGAIADRRVGRRRLVVVQSIRDYANEAARSA